MYITDNTPSIWLQSELVGGVGGWLVEIFTRQLGGQVELESGNKGTIVYLILPSRESSYDLRA